MAITLYGGVETRVNTTAADDQTYPAITTLADGGYVVTWASNLQDGSSYGIYAQRYDPAGAAIGSETRVNTTTADLQYDPNVVALSNGGYVVTWESFGQDGSGFGVYAQRYDAAGAAVGSETRVNTTISNHQLYPAAAALANGAYVITWTSTAQDGSGNGIYSQRYNATGSVVGSQTQVNTTTANDQELSAVTGLTNGGYVVTWRSNLQDGSGYGVYAQRYDAAGTAAGSETRVNTTTAGDQRNPSVTALADGGYVVAWDGATVGGLADVYAQRYNAAGAAVGTETLVNTITANAQGITAITALKDGGYVVTWTSASEDGSTSDVCARRYDAAGAAMGTETLVTTTTTNAITLSSVSALADGGYVIALMSRDTGADLDIYRREFRPENSSPIVANPVADQATIQGAPITFTVPGTAFSDPGDMLSFSADLADGSALPTWLNFNAATRTFSGTPAQPGLFSLRVTATDSHGASASDDFSLNVVPFLQGGAETRVNTTSPSSQFNSSVAALTNGGYVVTWDSQGQDGEGGGIYAQRYDANGGPVGGETRVNTTTALSQEEPAVAALADGGYVVTWQSQVQELSLFDGGRPPNIYAQRYSAAGIALGAETRVNTYTADLQLRPCVAGLADGGYVVTWHSITNNAVHNGIYAQRYGADGLAIGGETQVNSTAGTQTYSAVTGLANGGYVITWSSFNQDGSSNGIYAQRYNAAGTRLGNETRVNTFTPDSQVLPDVTALSNGGYVVTWASNLQDGSGNGIYAQRYDAAGISVGAETRVNTTTANDQLYPALTTLADGGYIVTWASNLQDGSGWGSYAQRYDASGIAVGGEMRVNTTTAGDQRAPDIAGLADGGYVVTWDSPPAINDPDPDIHRSEFHPLTSASPDVNHSPTGSPTGALAAGIEDTPYTFSTAALLQGFTDSDGDSLSLASLDTVSGTLHDNGNGTWTLTPWPNASGTVVLKYEVIDGHGGYLAATQSFSLAGVNDAPIGSSTGTLVAGIEDTPYTISAASLLQNISDPDGDSLSVVNLTSSNGSLHANGNGTWTLTPSANFNGPVVLSYDVADGHGGSLAATRDFSLAAVEDEPTGFPTAVLSAGTEDTPYTFSRAALVEGFTDVDGDSIFASYITSSVGDWASGSDGTLTLIPPADFNGTVTVDYLVLDGLGGWAAARQSFVLAAVNDAPRGLATATLASGSEDTPYIFSTASLLQGFTDVEGDTLSIANLTSSIGTLHDNGNGTLTLTPSADFNGTVGLNYEVSDGQGGSTVAAQSFSLAPVNDAPVGAPTASLAAGSEDTLYTFSAAALLQGFTDVDGDTLSVANLKSSSGTLHDNGNGTWTLTPPANFNGTIVLSYDVTDGHGGSVAGAQGFSLAAVNDAPAGSPIATLAAGSEDTPYTFSAASLLQGFSDVEGDSLSVGNLKSSNGTLHDDGNSTWTLTPSANFNGVVALNYDVTDGQGGSIAAAQSFSLAAVNDAPAGSATAALVTGSEDTPYIFSATSLLQGFNDVDGDSLSVANLKASSGALHDNGNGTWILTPAANFNGTVALNYDVTDGQSGSVAGAQSFSLAAVNDAPAGSPAATFAAGSEDTPYTISAASLLQGFSDVDGDSLSVANLKASSGALHDNGNGTWTLTPSANFNGAVALNYDVSDGQGGSIAAAQSFSLAAVNDAPTGAPSATLPAGTEDTPYTFSTASLLQGFSDVDGDTLSVVNLKTSSGALHDNGNGTWTLTPVANFNGAVTLNYDVSDGHGGSVAGAQSLSLAAVNDAPAGSPTATLAAGIEDTAYTFTAASLLQGFTDVEGDSLSVANLSASSGTLQNNGNGTWTLSQAAGFIGEVTLSYAVSDGQGGFTSAAQTVQIASKLGTAAGDTLMGTSTDDYILGMEGNDVIDAKDGDDYVDAGPGDDVINGKTGDDVLLGGPGNDTMHGGTGADILYGGTGNDSLFGSANAVADKQQDIFVFDTIPDASTNVDLITGFEIGVDKVALDPSIYAAFVAGTTSGIDANEFRANAGGIALDANDYLLYDTITGNLYYDADANGAGAPVMFAKFIMVNGDVPSLISSYFTTTLPL